MLKTRHAPALGPAISNPHRAPWLRRHRYCFLFPPAFAVGVMFLVTGACCLWLGERALAPWAMGVPFAAGQGGLAVILWWHHDRRQAPPAIESIR